MTYTDNTKRILGICVDATQETSVKTYKPAGAELVGLTALLAQAQGSQVARLPQVAELVLKQWIGETWLYDTLKAEAVKPKDISQKQAKQANLASLRNPRNLPLQAPTHEMVGGHWQELAGGVR